MKKSEKYGIAFGAATLAIGMVAIANTAFTNKDLAMISSVFYLTTVSIPLMRIVGENNKAKNMKGIVKAIDREPVAFYTSLLFLVPSFSILLYKLLLSVIEIILLCNR